MTKPVNPNASGDQPSVKLHPDLAANASGAAVNDAHRGDDAAMLPPAPPLFTDVKHDDPDHQLDEALPELPEPLTEEEELAQAARKKQLDEIEAAQEQRQSTIRRTLIVVGSLVLIVLVGFAIWQKKHPAQLAHKPAATKPAEVAKVTPQPEPPVKVAPELPKAEEPQVTPPQPEPAPVVVPTPAVVPAEPPEVIEIEDAKPEQPPVPMKLRPRLPEPEPEVEEETPPPAHKPKVVVPHQPKAPTQEANRQPQRSAISVLDEIAEQRKARQQDAKDRMDAYLSAARQGK